MTTASLTADQVEAYHRDGYLFPLTAMSEEQAAAYRGKLEALEAKYGDGAMQILRQKSHLVLTWVDELIRLEPVLDVIESLIGPDIYCWSTSFFIKNAKDPGYIAWHQDGPYSGTPEGAGDIITAWIALTPSNASNGCLKVVAGSHKELLEHSYTKDSSNMLSLGQEIAVEVDEKDATLLELNPGQFSLHHEKIIHGSAPNSSDVRRVGLAVRYLAPYMRPNADQPPADSASLVRGEDRYNTFRQDPRPESDLSRESVTYLDNLLVAKFGTRYRCIGDVVASV